MKKTILILMMLASMQVVAQLPQPSSMLVYLPDCSIEHHFASAVGSYNIVVTSITDIPLQTQGANYFYVLGDVPNDQYRIHYYHQSTGSPAGVNSYYRLQLNALKLKVKVGLSSTTGQEIIISGGDAPYTVFANGQIAGKFMPYVPKIAPYGWSVVDSGGCVIVSNQSKQNGKQNER